MLLIYRGKDINPVWMAQQTIIQDGIYDVTDIFTDEKNGHVYGHIYGNGLLMDLGPADEFRMNWEPYK